MRKFVGLAVAGEAAKLSHKQKQTPTADEKNGACSSNQKMQMSQELLRMANNTITESSKDVQWFLLTKNWSKTKEEIGKELPDMTHQMLDDCRKENMSYFLELFAKRKISLTSYPQVKKGQQPAALLQQGKNIVDKVANDKTHRSSFAQTKESSGTTQGAPALNAMPDFTQQLMKRHTQTEGLLTGLKATVASMAQMNSMPAAPDANVNNTVIDDKIKQMLHMNETNLNGELTSLVSGLSDSLTHVDKEVTPQATASGHQKTETELMLEALEKEDAMADQKGSDDKNLMGTEALNIGILADPKAGAPVFDAPLEQPLPPSQQQFLQPNQPAQQPQPLLMEQQAQPIMQQQQAPVMEQPIQPLQQPTHSSMLQAAPHLQQVKQNVQAAIPNIAFNMPAGQTGVNLAQTYTSINPQYNGEAGLNQEN